MSDEIKEILEFDFETQGERIEINEYERNKIKDYIINLQQENKQLKVKSEVLEENNKLLIQQKYQMYEDLDIAYERIDKAIEYIKLATDNITEYLDIKEIKELLEILGDKENENNK